MNSILYLSNFETNLHTINIPFGSDNFTTMQVRLFYFLFQSFAIMDIVILVNQTLHAKGIFLGQYISKAKIIGFIFGLRG